MRIAIRAASHITNVKRVASQSLSPPADYPSGYVANKKQEKNNILDQHTPDPKPGIIQFFHLCMDTDSDTLHFLNYHLLAKIQ